MQHEMVKRSALCLLLVADLPAGPAVGLIYTRAQAEVLPGEDKLLKCRLAITEIWRARGTPPDSPGSTPC